MTATTLSSADGLSMPAAIPNATLPPTCTTHFDLLRAAKRAGRRFGLGPQDLHLLEYYLSFTRREDWAEGKRPLYTRPVTRTAAALGVSPRSINTAERRLERLGLIHRATRADGARGGWGGEDNGPLYGIDLTPLITAQDALNTCAAEALAEQAKADSLRAAISRLLGEARRIMADCVNAPADAITRLTKHLPRRTPQTRDISFLQTLLNTIEKTMCHLRTLVQPVDNSDDPQKSSDAPEENCPPLYNTSMNPNVLGKHAGTANALQNLAENKAEQVSPLAHGLQHLKGRDISLAMPQPWHDLTRTQPGQFLWPRFAMAAEARLPQLGIAEAIWHEATAIMGREAAALSLMILDANRTRPDNPVRNIAGALRAMTRRAERGTLRLHASVYGLIARNRAGQAA